MALLTVGPTFDQVQNKINKISLKILRIRNSEIWLFDDVSKILGYKSDLTKEATNKQKIKLVLVG